MRDEGSVFGGREASVEVGQDPDSPRAAVAEDEQAAGKRIGVQFLPAQLCKRIYTSESIPLRPSIASTATTASTR
jgi:hypothetical protein